MNAQKIRYLIVLSLSLTSFILLSTVFGRDAWQKRRQLQQELTHMLERQRQLVAAVDSLKLQINGLRQDAQAVQYTLRDRLGYVGENEVVVRFKKNNSPN